MNKYRSAPRAAFILFDDEGQPSITADEVHEEQRGDEQTGLFDQFGQPLVRRRERIKFGFVP